jgi:hypothetical protein
MDGTALEQRLAGRAPPPRPKRLLPDSAYLTPGDAPEARHPRPALPAGVSGAHPDGYGYTQLCHYYREARRHLDVTLRQEHRAGEKLTSPAPRCSFTIRTPAMRRLIADGGHAEGAASIRRARPRLQPTPLSFRRGRIRRRMDLTPPPARSNPVHDHSTRLLTPLTFVNSPAWLMLGQVRAVDSRGSQLPRYPPPSLSPALRVSPSPIQLGRAGANKKTFGRLLSDLKTGRSHPIIPHRQGVALPAATDTHLYPAPLGTWLTVALHGSGAPLLPQQAEEQTP